MKKKKRNKKNWFKYSTRIVGMDPITFQERWRIKINRMQLMSLFILLLFVLAILFYFVFSYTPIGLLLPENIKNRNKEKIESTIAQIEKLENKVSQQDMYIKNLQEVILGNISIDSTYRENEFYKTDVDLESDTTITDAEIKLSEQIEAYTNHSTENHLDALNELFLYDPVQGVVSQKYNENNHPGVDIITKKESTIKACLEGVVLHASYDDQNGYTLILSHQNDINSVYKHASKVLVGVGEKVSTGDAIAIVGNSGENSTGPHLHFELWSNIGSLNPLDYLSFKE
ncbi:MAG: M23 family metallopeptidase [Brumimicrobium sp.]